MDDLDRERSSRTTEGYRRKSVNSASTDYSSGKTTSTSSSSKPPTKSGQPDYQDYDYDDPPRTSTSRSSGQPERYSDRFRRSTSTAGVDPAESDDVSNRSTRDPYDRLRKTANKPPRRVEIDDDGDPYGYIDDGLDDRDGTAPRSRASRARRQQRPSPARAAAAGMALARPAAEVRPLMYGGAAALGSLLLLSILILVRSGSADTWLPMHLDAEGTPTVYGSTSAIWRLPFFALMSTICACGLGWWLRVREPFAAQYLIVGALMVHAIIWVGTITLLW